MPRVFAAAAVPIVFALLGWAVRGVTLSGAIAGCGVAFALYYCISPAAFSVLFSVFAITWLVTRVGYLRKQSLGIAENRRGRNALQVLANTGVSGACAALFCGLHRDWLVVAAVAALAEAAADTASSEVGEAFSDSARLITNFRPVRAGTNGAVTALGTLAGIAAAAITSAVAAALSLLAWRAALVALLAAVVGTVIDSLLGATLERRRLLDNNAVNFLGTLSASLIAALLLLW